MRARHETSTSYYLEIGFDALPALLADGVQAVLTLAGLSAANISHAFAGLPAHGEDSALLARFDGLFDGVLPRTRCTVGNDMVCSWAGSLAGADGISLVAGTGSIAYGEWTADGRRNTARCGGWGELFGDEGSAYWLAREGLSLFSRMADGRAEPGPLLPLVRQQFQLKYDLDLCAVVNGAPRSHMAQLARLVSTAAEQGDRQALQLLVHAGQELAQLAVSVARQLVVNGDAAVRLPVSYSGGVITASAPVLTALRQALADALPCAELVAPRFGPEVGAAIQAARLSGQPLSAASVATLPATI